MISLKNIRKFIILFHHTPTMGQQEVIDYLRNHPDEWYTSRNLEKLLSISIGSINESLRKLRERKEINFKISVVNGRGKPQYLYNFKN
jgi:transcription initiation factor IIE alpha subunit